MGKNLHITPRPNGWAVISAGAERAAVIAPTQAAAAAIGREMAINRGSELLIHGRNGQIRERNSYGYDPESSKADLNFLLTCALP
ncbi:DUF2188 domain-containing protein [Hymenobacter sp. AT01-02]|uniref:DUF2188 domain-containing protein n=1 Tax=Hymenobacter sp. AT01-02 TaxID=1571877 RepID=UPI0006E386C0|nr:DUF2188 domain-containing protein [Hymenobacter sp. AT01-02]